MNTLHHPLRLLFAVALITAPAAAACEDVAGTGDSDVDAAADTADAAGADVDATLPPPANPLFDPAGEIGIIEHWSAFDGAVAQSEVVARLFSGPQPNLQQIRAVSGDCQLWLRPAALCEPPCNAFTQACVPGPTCVDLPEGRSAGDIAISGTTSAIALAYAGNGLYAAATDPPADAFAQGAAISVQAAGGQIAAFGAALTGVGDLADALGEVALVDGQSTTLNWAPAGDGSTVEVVLQLGWHANPPDGVVFCSAPDSAGSIVIAAEIAHDFPYFEGMGLFQVPSWIQRVSRREIATAAGPVTVYVASRQSVSVTHRP